MDELRYYDLTHPQKRIWYIEKIYPDTSMYNIGGITRFKGKMDFALLEAAIQIFIQQNDGFRLQLMEEDGVAKQYVSEYTGTKLDFIDFSTQPDPRAAFQKWREEEPQKAFSLLNSPLYQFILFRLHENDGGYLLRIHHIIADGWSMDIMTKGICDVYKKLALGQKVIPEPSPSYLDYVAQEQEYLQSSRFLKNKKFWNDKFKELPDSLPGQGYSDIAGRRKTYQLSTAESEIIKDFCKAHQISLNTFFVNLFFIYLYKTSGGQDLIIGTPVLNRSGQKEKAIFGMFTSTMPLRINFNPRASSLEVIYKVNQELMDCFYHQKYPYNLLVADLELKKKGFDSLIEVCVNYYNTNMVTEMNEIKLENTEFYNGNQFYALQMIIRDWSDDQGLLLDFDYQLKRYDEKQIDAVYQQLRNLERQVISAPEMPIGKLCLLSEEEKDWLIRDFNNTATDYPKDKTIQRLFEEQAQRTPERIALRFKNKELSYGELNRKANQLAGYLRKRGADPGSIVALITTHSLETVIAILGILKVGAAYLPIDPGYPPERIHYMLQDSGATLILSNCLLKDFPSIQGAVIMLNDPGVYSGPDENPLTLAGPDDPVYIIYTSGSTGKPKGVVIEHRGLVNYIWWAKKMYVRDETEAFALYSSLAFDLTVTSIFTPLIGGNPIVIYHDDGSGFILDPIMEENQVHIIKLTPSHLSLLTDRDNSGSNVRRFIVGGEDLKVSLAARIQESFGGQIEIYNEYGPTETVVGCMIHQFDPRQDERSSVPIGIPAENVQIYVLDHDLQPVPPGAKGELYIAGDGVARGYLNRPELTMEKFISVASGQSTVDSQDQNLLDSQQMSTNGTDFKRLPTLNSHLKNNCPLSTVNCKLYKTGDLAQFLENGKLEYWGRSDHQVKIRGHRIELGEIEGLLQQYPLVKNGVVIDREDSRKQKYLCAYYESEAPIPENDLRKHLWQTLPESMIPSYFVQMNQIPLTSNGKVNRNLLPEPAPRVRENLGSSSYANEPEAKLAAVIAEVLNLDRVDPGDNFYHLGGDSIKAIQIAAKLKNQRLQIKVKDILSNPLIREMAAHLKAGTGAGAFEPCAGPVGPTPITAWFFTRNFKNPNHWNQSVLLQLEPEINGNQIELALNILIKYHDTFRLNYDPQTGQLFYNPAHLNHHYSVETFDLSALPAAKQDLQLEWLGGQLKSGFDIKTGILLKAGLFELGPRGKRLLFIAHHLAVDGVSWRIILEDFVSLLAQARQEKNPVLPPKTASFQQWAQELAAYGGRLASEPAMGETDYWETVVGEPFQFPVDNDIGDHSAESSVTLIESLAGVELEALNTANQAYNTRTHELLVIGLVLAVRELLRRDNIVIELEGHGREEIFDTLDISRTVGWFTTMYPVLFRVEEGDLALQIKSLKEQLRKVPNQGFNFGILKYFAGCFDAQAPTQLRFNYLGDFAGVAPPDFFQLAPEKSGPDCAPENDPTSIIEVNALVIEKSLQIRLTYSPHQLKPETIGDFLALYQRHLQAIIAHCQQKDQAEFTPSDFDTVDLSQADLNSLFGD